MRSAAGALPGCSSPSTRAGQKVALKILHPEFLESVAADRFLREIRLVSQLNHPHIARLLASGEREWLVYITTAFIDGASLRDVLGRDRRLSVGDTLRMACDLLGALDHAHQLGIVHRDVKPENVIISPARSCWILESHGQSSPRSVRRSLVLV